MDTDLDELIAQKSSQREIIEMAEEKGFRSLVKDGIRQILSGHTTLSELSRVVDLTAALK